jgi:hypothetical protein
MGMKQAPKKTYRTANGKVVDMDLLRQRNELVPAVGNARVNARGDELGPNGQIIRKREDILADFYKTADDASAAARVSMPEVTAQTAPVYYEEDEEFEEYNRKSNDE